MTVFDELKSLVDTANGTLVELQGVIRQLSTAPTPKSTLTPSTSPVGLGESPSVNISYRPKTSRDRKLGSQSEQESIDAPIAELVDSVIQQAFNLHIQPKMTEVDGAIKAALMQSADVARLKDQIIQIWSQIRTLTAAVPVAEHRNADNPKFQTADKIGYGPD